MTQAIVRWRVKAEAEITTGAGLDLRSRHQWGDTFNVQADCYEQAVRTARHEAMRLARMAYRKGTINMQSVDVMLAPDERRDRRDRRQATDPAPIICKTCRWWGRTAVSAVGPNGERECCFNPPAVVVVDGRRVIVRPMTHPNDCCAQHSDRRRSNHDRRNSRPRGEFARSDGGSS